MTLGGNGGVCDCENVSQDIVPISTNTQSHLSLLMDCLTLLSIVSLRAGSKSLQPPLTRMSGDVGTIRLLQNLSMQPDLNEISVELLVSQSH